MEARGLAKDNQRAVAAFALLLILAAPSKKLDNIMVLQFAPYQASATNWLQFKTDACGQLSSVESRHSTPSAVAASDDYEADSDDEWVNGWNMSPEQSVMMNAWLSRHPDVSTVTSAVERECNDDQDPVDDMDTVDIA